VAFSQAILQTNHIGGWPQPPRACVCGGHTHARVVVVHNDHESNGWFLTL